MGGSPPGLKIPPSHLSNMSAFRKLAKKGQKSQFRRIKRRRKLEGRNSLVNPLPPKNFVSSLQILVFIVFMLTRFGGGDGEMIEVGENEDKNAEAFAYMVVFGYFYILIVQLIGIALGEEMNVQNLIYTCMGFIFFLSVGSVQIGKTRTLNKYETVEKKSNRMAMGSISILTGFVFLGDTIFTVYQVKKDRSSY